jgi:N-acetylmuramoyl-L-alanine amidase
MERDQVKYIVVHCSATPPAMDIGEVEINQWHIERGFNGCGYHGVIRRNGKVESNLCRKLDRQGAHVQGHNHESIGICLVGGVDAKGKPENNFTPEQMASLRMGLYWLNQKFPDASILGHRDFPEVNKACPCFDVRAWLNGELSTEAL